MAGKEENLVLKQAPKKSRRCKCCIGCAVATVVVLAVAIPVGICVVGPALAQQAIDMSTLHIHHSNIMDVPDTGVNGTMHNVITIHSPSILSGTMQEQTVTMVVDQPDAATWGITNGPLGNFTMPSMKVKHGDNPMSWTTPTLFNMSADGGFRFVFWSASVLMLEVARINLTSEPVLKSFGLSFKTKMTKQMVCNCLKGAGCNPKKPKFNNSRRLDEDVGAIGNMYLFCEPYGVDVSDASKFNGTGLVAETLSALANRFLA